MEDQLEAAILGNANDEDIEFVFLDNIVGGDVHQHGEFQFNLDDYENEDVKAKFRFDRENIYRLIKLLHIPEVIITRKRVDINSFTAFCILLNRLAYPNRLIDIQQTFGMPIQTLSDVIIHMVNLIYQQWRHLLENLHNINFLDENKMNYYAEAVRRKGGAVPNCWGFIDGTARSICRPSINQQEYYSGHKRYHCVQFHSVLCPDGMIVSLKGAYPGSRHDAGIFRNSTLFEQLEQVARFENRHFVLYGDQAYGVMELLLCPFPARRLEEMLPHHREFNRSMKVLRTSVEWGFQKVVSLFAFVDFKKNQKILLQNVDIMYKVSVLLTNCHTCDNSDFSFF